MSETPTQKFPVKALISADGRFGFNPLTRRYILRTGGNYLQLVKTGIVTDEEIGKMLVKQPIEIDAAIKNVQNKHRSLKNRQATIEKNKRIELAKSNETEKIIPTKEQIRDVAREANRIVKKNKYKLNKLSKEQADNQLRKLLIRKLELKTGDRTMANLKSRIERVVQDLTTDVESTTYEDSSSEDESESD
jgi:hypothetical protein